MQTPATQAPGTIVTIAGAGDGGSVEEGVPVSTAHVEDPIRISFDGLNPVKVHNPSLRFL